MNTTMIYKPLDEQLGAKCLLERAIILRLRLEEIIKFF